MAERVTHLVVGPASHGVTRHALELLAQPALAGAPVVRAEEISALDLDALPRRLHLHVTDRLFGARAEEAAAVLARVVAGREISATLHDVPQPGDGPAYPRRVACYRVVTEAAHRLVVASDHEACLLAAAGLTDPAGGPEVDVIPLPVEPPDLSHSQDPRPIPDGQVGVLGFLYPGKGHGAVLDALGVSGLPPTTGLLALGRPSDGHADLVTELEARATELGRPVAVTGYLDDAALLDRARTVSVPVCAPEKVSASGSVGSWISAGRRPLVVSNPYAEELLAAAPGVLTLVEPWPEPLAAAIATALEEPDATWLAAGDPLPPGPAEVAARYADALGRS